MDVLAKKDIKNRIVLHSKKIKSLGVSTIGLFGSYVRGEQKKTSDIDILVTLKRDRITFNNYMNFCFFMDDIFKEKKVTIVTKKGLSPYIAPYILKEVEYVKV